MLKKYLAAALMLSTAACSGGSSEPTDAATTESSAATEANFQLAIACQANLDAVGRIYSVLATQETGAEQEKMAAMTKAREQAAAAYREQAKKVGAELGHPEAEIAAAIKASDDYVKAEFERREFGDFATWVASQADGCPPSA